MSRQISPGGLVRGTFNLTPSAEAALDRLTHTWGLNRTDALNRALRLAERVERWTVDDCLTVIADGKEAEMHLL